MPCCKMSSFLCFVSFFSPEVQSILNLSPPQDAELMNANPSPPVSIFELNSELCASSSVYTWHMQGCTHFLFEHVCHTIRRCVIALTLSIFFSCSPVHPNRSTSVHLPTLQPNPATFTSSKWLAKAALARSCWHATVQMTSSMLSKSYRKRPFWRRRR